ncbi:MAG: hypothetical protein WAW96_03420 [Alphaproteobacteria bacterium]
MKINYLAAGITLAALLSACGQKQGSTASAPQAPAETAQTQPAATPAPAPSAEATTTPAPAAQASAATPAQFDSKTGRVEFTLSGMQTGTETTTWDDYGARTVTETKTTTSIGNLPPRTHQRRVIRTGDTMIVLDLQAKTAMKMDHIIEQAKAVTGSQDMRVFSEQMMAQMGASKTGSDAVAGKSCDVWTMTQMGMTLCVWKGLALRTDGNMMGVKIAKLATKVDENVAVDPALFEIPAGFTTTDAPSLDAGAVPGMPGGAMMGSPSAPSAPGAPTAPAPTSGN